MLRQFGAVMNDEFIKPQYASKTNIYKCPDCRQQIILKCGKRRSSHFSHKIKCNMPTKSIIQQIKELLEANKLVIHRQCGQCSKDHAIFIPNTPSTKVDSIGSTMTITHDNEIKYIFETGYFKHGTNNWFKIKINDQIISCTRDILCDDCIQGQVYFNQRGAGCGKTYESIQLLNNATFNKKNIIIYLTKTHSAKEVIYGELMQQYKNGHIKGLDLVQEELTNKYKIVFNKGGEEKIIIIGTIDSFTYNIYDKKTTLNELDYFNEIVNQLIMGNMVDAINYANTAIQLDNKTLIVIDEAQDLGKNYMDAFISLVHKTKVDLYIIGDKLQSIWGVNNIYTCIDQSTATINKSEGINQVMRFHNEQFKGFVNALIPYHKYDLPQIEKICDKPCKYCHENIKPYTIFDVAPYYRTDIDDMYAVINKIKSYIEKEIETYNYAPNNFMFIFPILKKNTFAHVLSLELNNFWISRYNKQDKYVYLHTSEPGKTINLKESENATRILSIHTSKGSGCEVVFVLGMTEHTLNIFSKQTDNIIYNSLLHVAITRQKKAIYVGIENNNDDICRRFKNLCLYEPTIS